MTADAELDPNVQSVLLVQLAVMLRVVRVPIHLPAVVCVHKCSGSSSWSGTELEPKET